MKCPIDASNSLKPSPKTKGVRLQRLRNLTNLSRQTVCEKFNIKHGTLKGWEVGTATGLTKTGADQLLKAYESEGVICSYEWLMYDIGSGPRITEKTADMNNIFSNNKNRQEKQHHYNEEKKIIRELHFLRENNPQIIDMIVNDDGMLPFYQIGYYLAGIKQYNKNIAQLHGSDCIVQTKDGQLLLRNIRKGNNHNCYNLLCTNLNTNISEPVLYEVELISAARIVWIRRQY